MTKKSKNKKVKDKTDEIEKIDKVLIEPVSYLYGSYKEPTNRKPKKFDPLENLRDVRVLYGPPLTFDEIEKETKKSKPTKKKDDKKKK